jgi:3-hydroxybutyryl-CoA dehydratase
MLALRTTQGLDRAARPVQAGVADRPCPRTVGPITQTDIVRFAGAGGDFNPLHHDPEFAASAGFERPIAMGQLTAGLLAAWLTDLFGAENLLKYEVRFTAPLTIGDVIELSGVVTSVEELEDGFGVATVELTAARGKDPLVMGRASVVVRTG